MNKYVLQIGALNDATLVGVSHLVSRYEPFSNYSFRLMFEKICEQLKNQSNIILSINGRAVAYAGWLKVDDLQAKQWLEKGGKLPEANWSFGNAAIVTIVVSEDKQFLFPLIKAISHVCAGKKVYRLRSFNGGRPDMRRPPIVGRVHTNLKSNE